jgi:hypothetical protein
MRSRWFTNILLLLAIGILTMVARYEPGIEKTPEAQAITALKKNEVQRIHINRPVRDDLVLTKDSDSSWKLQRTPALPAGSFQVGALLKLVEQEPVRSYAVSDLDLSKLQLAPPTATVVVNDTAVEFGSLEPLEGLRYVRISDQVHLIPDLYQHLIEAHFTQFVRRRLFEGSSRIDAVRLPGLSLTREDRGWSVVPPQDVAADALQQFVDRWQQAVALHIQTAEPGQSGEPVEISFSTPPDSVTLLIAEREPELVLVRPELGIQYRMGNITDTLLSLAEADSENPE